MRDVDKLTLYGNEKLTTPSPIDLYKKNRCEPCEKEEKCGYVKREHCAIISMALDSYRIRELKEEQMKSIEDDFEFADYQQKMERYVKNRNGG